MLHHRPSKSAIALRLVLSAFALGALACSAKEDKAPVQPPPPPSTTDQIPSGTLGGKLGSEIFSVKSARYFIDRRPSLEKVEITLSNGSSNAPCGEPEPETSPSVWLRRAGTDPIHPEVVRLTQDTTANWQVHYQVHTEDGWRGNGDASALFSIQAIGADGKLSGELWACFADPGGSCVSGRFVADYCTIRLDAPVRGSDAMERLPAGHSQPSKGEKR